MAAAVLVAAIACGGTLHGTPNPTRRLANLRAFARLYGVIRWFHPSDAAAAVDWDRVASDGARQVLDAVDSHALRAQLATLFEPIAPTMHIVSAGEAFPVEPALDPHLASDFDVVAWQHLGYGDSAIGTGYLSKRLHRSRTVAVPAALAAILSQALDASSYRGARIRLRGKLRISNRAEGRLWLRVDRGDVRGFFDNMAQHPVTSEHWTQVEIIGTVASDATRIVFGPLMIGRGTVWYDDLEVSISRDGATWIPIAISDPGFELADPFIAWNNGNARVASGGPLQGWNIMLDHDRPASGNSALRIEQAKRVLTDELFEDAPRPGETTDVDLGAGLIARIPIALYSKQNRTIGDDPEVARRAEMGRPVVPVRGDNVVGSVADVIVAWNVFKHFWPYWDVVPTNWDAQLDVLLADALADRTIDDHVMTLQRLTAAVPDGHASVSCPGQSARSYPPFAVDLVDDAIVVTTSSDNRIQRGDVIVSIDNTPAGRLLSRAIELVSGSRQWRVVQALQTFGTGPTGTTLVARVRRDGREHDVIITRSDSPVSERMLHAPIEPLEDGIYYVDLTRAAMKDIDGIVDRLAAASGVIFDVRGRPNHNHDVLAHLLTRRDDIRGWERIPRIIRPGSASAPSSWEDTSSWNMPVLQVQVSPPHISGKVAFLTDARAISYAEDVMTFIEHYHLGEIVGTATAGTDGDVAEIKTPTGCGIYFTGRRVTRLDGSRLHLIGVQPTIPVSRSLAGVAAGRDEVLERALVYVRGAAQ